MKLLRLLPLLFTRFRREARMVWGMMTHRDTPTSAKLVALAAVVYLISPIDLIPDVIPVIGWMDDAGILALFLSIAYKLLPKELYETLRARVDGDKATVSSATPSKPSTASGRTREPQIIDVTPEK